MWALLMGMFFGMCSGVVAGFWTDWLTDDTL